MCLQGDTLKYIVHSLKHYIKHILKSERPHFLQINAEVPSMWTKKNKILPTDSFFWYILFYGTCILLSRTLPNSLKEPSLFCLSTNQSTPLITTCGSTQMNCVASLRARVEIAVNLQMQKISFISQQKLVLLMLDFLV